MQQEHLPYQTHSATSRAAAAAIQPLVGTMRARVLALLRARGPLTDEQIQDELHMNPSTERPRRIELIEALLVRDSGQRRRTASGRLAVVWEVRRP